MSILYDILLIIWFLLSIPFLLIKIIGGKAPEVRERLGFLPLNIIANCKGEDLIWIHGVSVGETVAASPLISEIRELYPHYKIIFSTVTNTGREMAKKLIAADGLIYFPFDFPWTVKKVLTLLKPKLVILMETELWPNFIRTANSMGTKVMLANGRISERSARRYKFLGSFFKEMLNKIDVLAMQSEQDLRYILDLGAEREKVFNFGNTKYDLSSNDIDPRIKGKFTNELQIEGAYPVLVVGSTHANEEEELIPVYKKLKDEYENLVMILAPRHLERLNEIQPLYEKLGIPTVRRTELISSNRKASVIFLDTIGELFSVYSVADLVFIGGTLAKIGGHNILEPAAHGKTIFVGPYMYNFKEIFQLFLKHKACIQVGNNKELTEKMLYYLKNREESEIKGRNAFNIVQENKGATKRIVGLVTELLEK